MRPTITIIVLSLVIAATEIGCNMSNPTGREISTKPNPAQPSVGSPVAAEPSAPQAPR